CRSKKGPLQVTPCSDPPTIGRNRGPPYTDCSASRTLIMAARACFDCAIDLGWPRNASFCDGQHRPPYIRLHYIRSGQYGWTSVQGDFDDCNPNLSSMGAWVA